MIFGFNIITGIPEDLALSILGITKLKIAQYAFDKPANNPIRSIGTNYSCGQYWLRVNVNAAILMSAKETIDIEFIKEPDFLILNENFRIGLAEIIGKDNAERLPLLNEWGLWVMRYGMDITVDHIDELMRVFAKTDIPVTNLNSYNAAGMAPPFETYTNKLELYSKSELIELGRIEYKGTLPSHAIGESCDNVRLFLMHKRSSMGYSKRFFTKFEMDSWRLGSYLNPLVVPNAITKAYLDAIGNGDFYTYETAEKVIENKVSNFQNRKTLIELLNHINVNGSIAKARVAHTDGKKFSRALRLLRDIGINGALLDHDSGFERLRNPIDEIYEKCKAYSF